MKDQPKVASFFYWALYFLLVSVASPSANVLFAKQIDAPSRPDESPTTKEPSLDNTSSSTPQETVDKKPQPVMARGRVFVDLDNNGMYSVTDAPFVGVKVSNGIDIVTTDGTGTYEIAIEPTQQVFVIKPNGYRTRLNQNNLPQFFYLHKPDGSPKLKYPGSKPTGPLPRSIDFPLYQQQEPEAFKILLFGDPQPRDTKEVDYISQDVISELVGQDDKAFGVTLGDIAFDNLDTFKPLNQSIALIGIPWYNVIGNHDLNLDAKNRDRSNETFEATFGPTYYSFDYGQVHFVVLDNIGYLSPSEREGRGYYEAHFGKQQIAWLEKDLKAIPESQMVVLLMHIPIMGAKDKSEVFRLIESRPYCVSVSGHTHDHRHVFLGKEDGFNGKQPHHHIVNVTVSGAWWSGAKNENGIPHSTMKDGAPNGYSIMTFDDAGYRLDFKAAGQPENDQLRIEVPRKVSSKMSSKTDVWVNVYNGSDQSKVRMAIGRSGKWVELEKTVQPDPYFIKLHQRDAQEEMPLTAPKPCFHLWKGQLPQLEPGTHLLVVETTDRHGRTYSAHRSIRVTGKKR